jgi:hypothetical protein
MDGMKRLLQDDLNLLTDRIAAAVAGETLAGVRTRAPEVYQRLEAASGALADLRADLLDRYDAWLAALDDCAAAWSEAQEEAPAVAFDRAA